MEFSPQKFNNRQTFLPYIGNLRFRTYRPDQFEKNFNNLKLKLILDITINFQVRRNV